MTESAKAIGLRLPAQVWTEVEKYGLENHSGGRGDKGFDVTQTLIALISRGLGIESKENDNKNDNTLDERITEIVRQQLDERITEIVRQQLDNSDTIAEGEQKTNIVIQELTQKELAARLKTSASTIARAVKGGSAAWAVAMDKYPDPEGLNWQPPGAAGGKFTSKH